MNASWSNTTELQKKLSKQCIFFSFFFPQFFHIYYSLSNSLGVRNSCPFLQGLDTYQRHEMGLDSQQHSFWGTGVSSQQYGHPFSFPVTHSLLQSPSQTNTALTNQTSSQPKALWATARGHHGGLQGRLVARENPRNAHMLVSSSGLLRIKLTEFAIPNQLRPSSAAASEQGSN